MKKCWKTNLWLARGLLNCVSPRIYRIGSVHLYLKFYFLQPWLAWASGLLGLLCFLTAANATVSQDPHSELRKIQIMQNPDFARYKFCMLQKDNVIQKCNAIQKCIAIQK